MLSASSKGTCTCMEMLTLGLWMCAIPIFANYGHKMKSEQISVLKGQRPDFSGKFKFDSREGVGSEEGRQFVSNGSLDCFSGAIATF